MDTTQLLGMFLKEYLPLAVLSLGMAASFSAPLLAIEDTTLI